MKKILGIVCTAIECFLFLWLVVGLWACANKIKELEDWQEEYMAANSHVETSDNKLLLVAMRCQKMEQDNDMLRLDIEEQAMVISNMQHSIDLLAFRVTDLESNSPGKEYHIVNGKVEERMPWEGEIEKLETRIRKVEELLQGLVDETHEANTNPACWVPSLDLPLIPLTKDEAVDDLLDPPTSGKKVLLVK